MKNVKTKIGMVLGSLLAAMIFMACEADAGTPDRSTIKATYNVDVKKVLTISDYRSYRYCLSDGVDYDSGSREFYGSGYVVRFDKLGDEYMLHDIRKYEDNVLACEMRTWDYEGYKYINIDESGPNVKFDSFTVKVHNETFSNNYMINVSCTNADKAQAL